MGNKRKRQEEDEKIAKKIKKLEQKLRRRRRMISSSDNDSDMEMQVLPSGTPRMSSASPPRRCSVASQRDSSVDERDCGLVVDAPCEYPHHEEPANAESVRIDSNLESGQCTTSTRELTSENLNKGEDVELEEDILQILGEAPESDLALGKNIHKDIATRWQDILIKGLPKEVKEPIMKKYCIPANCQYLAGPLLNPEAKAAIPDILAKRDASLLLKQNQIGVALSALSQVTEMVLKNETSKQALLQPLSDACRLLCDSHNIETKTRRSIVMSSINTGLREALTNTDRDKLLFGEDLAEKLKIAKSVQKTGESLLRTMPTPSSSKTQNRNYPKGRNLNSRGPVQRKPPNRPSEATRGRPAGRQSRGAAYARQPPPPPKHPSPVRKSYRR